MPLYEYHCQDCGEFAARRPMAECRLPSDCPDCGQAADRRISAPRLALVSSHSRKAHETNERSAAHPHTSQTYGQRHPAGCGCCSSKAKPAAAQGAGQPALKGRTGARPWMISH